MFSGWSDARKWKYIVNSGSRLWFLGAWRLQLKTRWDLFKWMFFCPLTLTLQFSATNTFPQTTSRLCILKLLSSAVTDVCCNLFNVKRGQRSDSSISFSDPNTQSPFILAVTWRTEQEVWTHLDCERSAWGHTLLRDLHRVCSDHAGRMSFQSEAWKRWWRFTWTDFLLEVMWLRGAWWGFYLLLMADTQSSMILYCRKTFTPCRGQQSRIDLGLVRHGSVRFVPPHGFVPGGVSEALRLDCLMLLTCLDCFPHFSVIVLLLHPQT